MLLLSADKNLAQIIGTQDRWWNNLYAQPLDRHAIHRKFGVWPEQIMDQPVLAGDKTDNIPGVPGIGMVTVAHLLRRFGDLNIILAAPGAVAAAPIRGVGQLAREIDCHRDSILVARRLCQIECNADLPGPISLIQKPQHTIGSRVGGKTNPCLSLT